MKRDGKSEAAISDPLQKNPINIAMCVIFRIKSVTISNKFKKKKTKTKKFKVLFKFDRNYIM